MIGEILSSGRFRATILCSDAAILALDAPGAELVDKSRLAERARQVGIRVPEGHRFTDGEAAIAIGDTFDYPAIVKPALKRGPVIQPSVVGGPRELSNAVRRASGPIVVQPFIDRPLRAVAGVVHGGRAVAWVHQRYLRTWPREAGVSCMAVTQEPDEDLEELLVRLLEGYDGIFQAQFAGDHLLDVNPRAYGSLPLAVAAGVNLPALHCAVAAGDRPSGVQRVQTGVRYRWVEGDVRHTLEALRDGDIDLRSAWRFLRPRRGTVHSVVSMEDPVPVLSRFAYAWSQLVRSRSCRG